MSRRLALTGACPGARETPLTERFLCVHAHCYQPPRENPWLESVEVQDSAYPYHDWNERVTAECYAPNTAARILDGEGRIESIVNNYARISFNFGPTLLSWMQDRSPEVYTAIQLTATESRESRSGHSSALAQAYNHMILPLANTRDKETQVLWGIRDYEHRFGFSPEGMWLPEAAVDLATLDALAAQGMRFTILSPASARQVRKIGAPKWHDVSSGKIDPSRAYRIQLPSGREMSLFFYDGPASRAVAFENVLDKGEDFAHRLLGTFSESRDWPQLAHIATDGETYGHHRSHGDMALAYALHYIESQGLARLTNYGEFLEKYPPTHDVEIFENTSWSCIHGIERWKSNCGCNAGVHPEWNQEWRAPLRQAMDWLRDSLAPLFEQQGRAVFHDPWQARNEYISVVLDRSPESVCGFLRRQSGRELSLDETILALKLLEMQRHAMLMYTSCGWFFDELSGIETVQAIQYAGRALQLADSLVPEQAPLEGQFLDRLSAAKSNIPENGDGRQVYERFVKAAMLDLLRVGAHYALSSLFENFGDKTTIYCYTVERKEAQGLSSGRARLATGRANITSDITRESAEISYGVVHLGDHLLTGGVRRFTCDEGFHAAANEITRAFEGGDFTELVHVVDKLFGSGSYTLRLLFRDEQRKIVKQILGSALQEAESAYRQLYENRAPLMRFLSVLHLPAIRNLQAAAEFTLNADLREQIEAEPLDTQRIQSLLSEVKRIGVPLDVDTIEFALRKKIEHVAEQLQSNPGRLALLEALDAAVDVARSMPLRVHLWRVQNIYFGLFRVFYPRVVDHSAQVDGDAGQWLKSFRSLGAKLSFRVE